MSQDQTQSTQHRRHRIGGGPGRLLAAQISVLAATLALAAAPALAVRGHVFAHAFNGKTPGSGTFEKLEDPAGIAVEEATGDVYVVSVGKDRVEWFNSTGSSFEGQLNGSATPAKAFSQPDVIAIDNACHLFEAQTGQELIKLSCERLDPSNGDVYVADTGHSVVDKFTPTGEYVGQLTGACGKREELPPCSGSKFTPFAQIDGVAVNTTGEVFVSTSRAGGAGKVYRFNNHTADRYEEEASIGPEPGALQLPGFAVDAQNDFYATFEDAADGERFVAKFDHTGAVLNARVEDQPIPAPLEGAATHGVAVELTTGEAYVDDITSVARFASDGEAGERLGGGELTSPGGVAVDATSGQLYAVDTAAGLVNEFTLEPAGPPLILGESAGAISSADATLEAKLDPHGEATSYRFEYGRCPSLSSCPASGYEHSAPAPGASAGADFAVHALGLAVHGLEAHVPYHFRLIAEYQAAGGARTVLGESHAFVTQAGGGELVLPDDRAWELVSPAQKNDALIRSTGTIQAAASGGAISYLASGPIQPEARGDTGAGVQVLSTRGAGGWSSQDLTLPHSGPGGGAAGHGGEFRLFSADLSSAAVQPFGPFTPLAAGASEQTAYLRQSAGGLYTPLVSAANVRAGAVFGGQIGGECAEPGQVACGPKFRGATPDLSHVVVSSPVALTEGAGAGQSLYEWTAGALSPLGGVSEEPQLAFHAISNDGSRVIFSGSSEGREGLLLRDSAIGKTVQLDAAQGCGSGCVSGGGEYQAASSDAAKVFFTDANHLTENSGATVNTRGEAEPDLYVCEAPGGQAACALHDLTPQPASGHAGVVGVLGASADGADVYFAANGVLTSEAAAAGAVQGRCKARRAPLGSAACNLYAIHYNSGAWEAPRLLAVLSAQDQPDWSPALAAHTARIAPDGGSLAFMSERSLTGYDNEDATSGHRGERLDEEVYLYRKGAGIACASCDPTGQRPSGVEYSRIEAAHGGLAGGEGVWPATAWIAAGIPGWEAYEPGAALYQPRYLSDGGRLFFDSSDRLVPQDANAGEDVYEFEPAEGAGRCTAASPTYSERAGGCLGLISSGSSSEEAVFLDAGENGGEAFLLTSSQLVATDTDGEYDVYDARECTAAAPCSSASTERAPECAVESTCKPAPRPAPAVEPSASATFSGPGNPAQAADGVLGVKEQKKAPTRAEQLAAALARCHKAAAKTKRRACELAARKKYGASTKGPAKKGKGKS